MAEAYGLMTALDRAKAVRFSMELDTVLAWFGDDKIVQLDMDGGVVKTRQIPYIADTQYKYEWRQQEVFTIMDYTLKHMKKGGK